MSASSSAQNNLFAGWQAESTRQGGFRKLGRRPSRKTARDSPSCRAVGVEFAGHKEALALLVRQQPMVRSSTTPRAIRGVDAGSRI